MRAACFASGSFCSHSFSKIILPMSLSIPLSSGKRKAGGRHWLTQGKQSKSPGHGKGGDSNPKVPKNPIKSRRKKNCLTLSNNCLKYTLSSKTYYDWTLHSSMLQSTCTIEQMQDAVFRWVPSSPYERGWCYGHNGNSDIVVAHIYSTVLHRQP